MKKTLLTLVLAVVLMLGILPGAVPVHAAESYGSFVSGEQVITDMIQKNGQYAHPRIIMTEDKFAELKSHIGEKSVTGALLEELRGEADRHVNQDPVCTYDVTDDDHLLETSKRVQRRVAALALAYNIFGDEKYAVRCYQELEAAAKFKDWSPTHFLDTAEMCTAFAYGYDWLYNWMTPEKRKVLRDSMIKKGLNMVMEDYKDLPRTRTYKWYQDLEGDNWQLVCTGGTNLVALAIGDESDARSVATQAINFGYKRAYSFIRRAYSKPDGTYIEGLGYWDYATYYMGLQSSALISATGTDYGLADYEGVKRSAEFIRYMSSNTPTSFSFGDDGESRNTGWAVFLWLGEYLNSPELSSVRLKNIIPDKEFRYWDILWIDDSESKQTGIAAKNPIDWGSVGASNASFRTNWDPSGLVTALHVGENNYKYHGHYDLGSFYLESNGARFFTDLGNENYKLENRQVSYRIKAEGHNTLVINPTEDIDQREGANCLITEYKSGNVAYAVTDLTDAYEPSGAKKVVRGLKMIKDKECVVVQDEISLNQPGEIYWFAHTKGTVDLASDARSAIVTVGSDRLWVGLLSEGGRFSVMDAEPLSTSKQVPNATSNTGYRKLAVYLTNTKDTTISVACIPLKSGTTRPSWIPELKAISQWKSETGTTVNPVIKPTVGRVSGLSLADQAAGEVTLKWSPLAGATGYVLEKNDGSAWSRVAKISGGDVATYKVTGLAAGSVYSFRIRGYVYENGTTTSGSNSATLTVETGKLHSITGLKVAGSNTSAIRLSWDKNEAVEGYQIEQLTDKGTWKMIKKIVGATITEYRVTNLTPGTGYKFRIRGYKTIPGKNYSDYTNISTCTKLPAMTNVKVAGRAATAVRLSWDKNAVAEGYQIEKKVGDQWKLYKKITSTDILEYRITKLTTATAYEFRVRAYKVLDGCVSYSKYVNVNTTTK